MSLTESTPAALPSGAAGLRWGALDLALLAGVLALALVLRVANFDAELSLDELWHLGTTPGLGSPLGTVPADTLLDGLRSQTGLQDAARPWHVWTGMDGVLHPPLYCLTLRFWREIFGKGDFAAHFYSTVWAMVAIGFLFATARLAIDRWAAAIVGVGTAISQAQMYFAQEVRSYQMLIGIATLCLWIMTRIEVLGPTRKRAIALALMTLPMLLTHYFAAGAALAVGVYGLLRLKGHRVAFILACAAAGLIYLVSWVPYAMKQVDDLYTGDSFLRVERFDALHELLLVFCSPWRLIIDKDYEVDRMTLVSGVLFIAPWLLVRRNRALLPWTIWLTGSILAIAALDVARSSRHMDFPRYFAVASPAVLLLAVGVFWALDRKAAWVFSIALLALIAIGGRVDERISVDSPYHSTLRNYVRDRIQPGEALLIYNGFAPEEYSDMLALTFSHVPQFQHRPTIKMSKPLSAEMVARLPERAWMATVGFDQPVADVVPGAVVIGRERIKDQGLVLHLQLRGEAPSSVPATLPQSGR